MDFEGLSDRGKCKMLLLRNDDVWVHALNHAVRRNLDKDLLAKFCNLEYRNEVIQKIEEGKWVITPPTVRFIPKDDGERREVLVNTLEDRVVLGVIYEIWYQLFHFEIHDKCVSYKRGVSIGKISKQLVNDLQKLRLESSKGDLAKTREYPVGYKVDIRKFFDTFPKDLLNKMLDAMSDDTPLDKLVLDYYNDDRVIYELEGISVVMPRYKSLAQGCALSALLADLALKGLDEQMDKMSRVYYRYSDDMIFFGKNCRQSNRLKDELQEILAKYRLALHPDKIKACSKDFEFLGVRYFEHQLWYGSKFVRNTKRKIREIFRFKPETKFDEAAIEKAIRRFYHQMMKIATSKTEDVVGSAISYKWVDKAFSLVTSEDQIRWLDSVCKDTIRHMFTGSWNHKYNYAMLDNRKLSQLGWVSLVHLWKCYNTSRQMYCDEIVGILNGVVRYEPDGLVR